MQLTLLLGKDVAVPVRFGGSASQHHGLVLRFGPMEHDGTVPGHLVASVGQERMAARRAVVWDPVLRSFAWGNRHDAERIAERLDPTAALSGLAGRGVAGACKGAAEFVQDMLRPQFILVGGIGTILGGYLLYYALWVVLAKTLLFWVILPGLAVAIW